MKQQARNLSDSIAPVMVRRVHSGAVILERLLVGRYLMNQTSVQARTVVKGAHT